MKLIVKPAPATLFAGSLMFTCVAVEAEPLEILINDGTIEASLGEVEVREGDSSPVLPADGGDFLQQLNGVSASRFGGRGLEPVIRGQSQTQLNILLDGAYVHGGCPNRMDPPASWAALETYERVTVEKGVQTLEHGAGGSGGTVLFERATDLLIDPKGGIDGKAMATTMSNGVSHDVSADVMTGKEQGYLRVFGQDRKADNYEDGDGSEVRSSYKHRQGGIVLGYTPAPDRLVEYSYEKNRFEDALYPGAGMDSPEEDGSIHRLKFRDEFSGPVAKVEADIFRSDIDHVMNNFSLRPFNPMMKRQTDTESISTGANVKLVSELGRHSFSYGLNIQNRERDAVLRNMNAGADLSLMWPGVNTDQSGVFAEADTALEHGHHLKYGLRFDRVSASASRADEVTAGLNRSANQAYQAAYGFNAEDKTENNVGALLRYEHRLSSKATLFSGLSRTVRTADATERYMNKWGPAGSRWIGNPDLNPEKHSQIDVGFTRMDQGTTVSGSVFYDSVDDFILRDTARGQEGILLTDNSEIYRNVDATIAGAELAFNTSLTSSLSLAMDVAWVRRINTTDGDRNIAQTPATNGKVQMDYRGSGWSAGGRIRYAAAQNSVDLLSKQEVGTSPGYGVLDVYGRYNLSSSTSLRIGMDNVFDKTYANHINRSDGFNTAVRVNEAGQNAWLKLVARF